MVDIEDTGTVGHIIGEGFDTAEETSEKMRSGYERIKISETGGDAY